MEGFRDKKKHTPPLSTYKIYIRSILESSSSVWCPYKKKKIEQIEEIQKTFTRLIYYRCYPNQQYPAALPSYKERLKNLQLEDLESRRKVSDFLLFRKIWLMRSRLRFSDFFVLKPCRGRTSTFEVFIPRVKNMLHGNIFALRVAKRIRLLPKEFYSDQTKSKALISKLSQCIS